MKWNIKITIFCTHPSWSNVKKKKMFRTNGQCRGLTITSLKMGTCVTTWEGGWGIIEKKFGFPRPNEVLRLQKVFWGPSKWKNWFSQLSPNQKVVTYVPIFRLVIVSALHWPFSGTFYWGVCRCVIAIYALSYETISSVNK